MAYTTIVLYSCRVVDILRIFQLCQKRSLYLYIFSGLNTSSVRLDRDANEPLWTINSKFQNTRFTIGRLTYLCDRHHWLLSLSLCIVSVHAWQSRLIERRTTCTTYGERKGSISRAVPIILWPFQPWSSDAVLAIMMETHHDISTAVSYIINSALIPDP